MPILQSMVSSSSLLSFIYSICTKSGITLYIIFYLA